MNAERVEQGSSADTALEPGQVPLDELLSIERAHDVRKLRACVVCDGLGMSDRMIDRGAQWFHGRCFVRAAGVTAFLKLPEAQLEKMAIGDLGTTLCRRVMRELQRASRLAEAKR